MQPVCYDPYVGTLGRFSRAEIFDMVAKAGYDGLNIPVNTAFLGDLSNQKIEDAVRLAETHHLIAPTVGFGNYILTHPGKADEVMRHFEVVMAVAKRFNPSLIGVWPSPAENASKAEARETLTANLEKIQPVVAESGMKIAIEFEKSCPIDNYREGMAYIEETGLDLSLTCDTYHLSNDKAHPYQAPQEMRALLGDVHVSGSHRGEPGTDAFDFAAFARGLKAINFQGPLVVQYHLKEVDSMSRSCEFTRQLREQINQ